MMSAARYYAEVLEMPRITERQADARVRIDQPEPTLSIIRAAGGVVVVLSHSGNWDLVGYHATRAIAPVTSVAEVLKPRELFDEFVELRASVGIRIYGHEGSATFRELLREATGQEARVLALLGDRDLSGSGVKVKMWGHGVRVAPGPAALSKASGKPLIPVMSHYERLRGSARRAARSRWGVVYRFGPVIEIPEGSSTEVVEQMSREWAAWMADAVAEYPQDWHMLQRFGWTK
jgi:KDO2-lipid IV(A) lauroyltransferase